MHQRGSLGRPSARSLLQAHAHKKGERDVLVLEVFPHEAHGSVNQLEQALTHLAVKGVTFQKSFQVEGACRGQ